MQLRFQVNGMSCAACSARVERAVSRMEGVRQVQVNLLTKSMLVELDESELSAADIIAAVTAAGYSATIGGEARPRRSETRPMLRRLLLSLLFLLPLMVAHHFLHGSSAVWTQSLLLLPILVLNRKFFISGSRALMQGAPNMDSLIALGAAAGIAYSAADILLMHSGQLYLESAGMILTFITLGKYLEARATLRTGSALQKLRALLPDQATLLRDGEKVRIPAVDIRAGDMLLVAAGERIPADACVCEGQSSIDESALTGESLPAEKKAGEPVYAGTINGNGALVIRAEKKGGDGALADIINLVGEATAGKAPIARVADRLSGIFVPLVIALALLTLLIWLMAGASWSMALSCAIAVLVISCPCALGLATPVAIMVGAGKGAENGILFRSGSTLEQAQQIRAIILDKTGTITAGQPELTDILPAHGHSADELLTLAATLENGSNHPLATAVMRATSCSAAAPLPDLIYRPGRGLSATVQGQDCAIGNAEFMAERGLHVSADRLSAAGKTALFVARDSELIGTLGIAAPVKKGSASAIRELQQQGLRILMMTGDNEATARAVAAQVGISEVMSGVLPQDKAARVQELQAQGLRVAMVGDGINDAPALTCADTGIAIGTGTDVALDSADILLMHSDLRDVPAALHLSRAVIRTIRQNLFWALAYNVAAIPLAAGLFYPLTGWTLSPALAAAAMSCSSLCVVTNALRLKRLRLTTAKITMTITIRIEGMMCPHCERHMTEALLALPGVTSATADHKAQQAVITTDEPLDEDLLAATVTRAGYSFKGLA